MGYKKKRGHEIVVVFDGWKSGSGVESSSMKGGVKVIYSRLGEKADAVIRRILSTERQEWIVVSSDREVASHAWGAGSVPIPSEEFLRFIEATRREVEAPMHFPGPEKDDENDMEEMSIRKGSGRMPSRKEKAVRRALGKL